MEIISGLIVTLGEKKTNVQEALLSVIAWIMNGTKVVMIRGVRDQGNRLKLNLQKGKIKYIMKYSIILVLPILLIGIVNAGTLDNVSGWAWSENIGWISFNCSNDETCGQSDYGVHVQDSGNIIGYAWSENIGWIDFNPSGVYPGLPNYSARLDLETREASGWARALSYGSGWDGWIKLRCYGSECNASDYGVYVDSGNFFDWAWGGDVVGWISFNCSNDGTCGQSDYKVITTFSFDDNPPLVSITGEPSNWINDNAEAVVNCSDEGGCDSASYRIRAYVNNPGSCSTTYNDYEEESPYTVESHSWICGAAKDLSGNLGFSEPVEFKVDKRNPSSAVTSPDNGSWHKDDFTATVMDSDTGGSGLDNSCQYRITDLNTGTSSGVKTRSCGQYSFNVSVGPNDICREDRIAPIGQSTCHVETQSFDKAGNSSGG